MKDRQIVYFGQEAETALLKHLQGKMSQRIFLVRGNNSYEKSGAKDLLEPIFSSLYAEITHFFDFSINPKYEDIQKGLHLLSKINPDLIIAVGGGSVIDMAKSIRFLYSYEGDISNGLSEKKHDLIPLWAIPTTAGTGSEATRFSVLYKDNVKYSVTHDKILPDIACVIPRLTYSADKYLKACSGFDALAQAIESYWNINATSESDKHAEKAIRLLWNNLPYAVNGNDILAMNAVSEGAYWAGKAINITKTTAPHAFSYAFTTYYGFPHGHAVALTFPFFMEYNIIMPQKEYAGKIPFEDYHAKMDKLLNIINFDSEKSIKTQIIKYIEALGLRFELPDNYNINLILENINQQRLGNNPRIPDKKIIKKLSLFNY
jgi:alcohol dehydrogenase class IV